MLRDDEVFTEEARSACEDLGDVCGPMEENGGDSDEYSSASGDTLEADLLARASLVPFSGDNGDTLDSDLLAQASLVQTFSGDELGSGLSHVTSGGNLRLLMKVEIFFVLENWRGFGFCPRGGPGRGGEEMWRVGTPGTLPCRTSPPRPACPN